MATKLEYAINLLASSHSSSSISVQQYYMEDEQPYLQTRELNRKNLQITRSGKILVNPMENKYNPDFIRKTMQMHEDIFKQQVRELHRLYSVQKMLMDELKKEIKQTRQYWTSNSISSDINHAAQIINRTNPTTTKAANNGFSFNFQSVQDHHHHHHHHHDPSPKERSGSCSGETTVRVLRRGFDLEMPAAAADHQEEDISTRVLSTIEYDHHNQAGPSSLFVPHNKSNKRSIHEEESDEDSDQQVELTLSIGGGTTSTGGKKMSKNCRSLELDSPASFKSDRAEDCSTPTTPMSSSSATTTFDQERKRPHWLFQGLSINRT